MYKKLYENEVVKKQYFSYLKDVKGFSDSSIKASEQSITLWQEFNNNKDFKSFGKKEVTDFKDWLKKRQNNRTKELLSLTYLYHLLRRLRGFFEWLSMQPNFRSSINPSFIEYLRLSKKETRVALQSDKRDIPSMEEVIKVIESIDIKNEVDKRDRALICFTLLTGARISAIISLPMKSFDKDSLVIDQNPKYGVKTKFSKRITTSLFPLSYEKALEHFLDWYDYLKLIKNFKACDPIFPMTEILNGEENISYHSTGKIIPKFWAGSGQARKIFEKRFLDAEVPYYHPHTFRHLVVSEFVKASLTEEEKKAVSQNLGHENTGTTFGSYGYGHIEETRQIDIVKNIRLNGKDLEGKFILTPDEIRFIEALRKSKN